jgi:hypothetical protein
MTVSVRNTVTERLPTDGPTRTIFPRRKNRPQHHNSSYSGPLPVTIVYDCCNRPIVTLQTDATLYVPAFHEFPDFWSLFCYKGLSSAHTCVQMQYPYHGYNPAAYAVFFFLNVIVKSDRVACKSTARLTMLAGLMRLIQSPRHCQESEYTHNDIKRTWFCYWSGKNEKSAGFYECAHTLLQSVAEHSRQPYGDG